MKIINLTAENVKRLAAVSITPDGNVVQITGRNGQGKTSVLDSIWWAMAGAGNVQAAPIRKGQKSARIRLDLGELVVTRTFKQTDEGKVTTAITVENAEGARFPSPQTMLDALLGSLSFDPLAFARMAPKDQFNELKRFVPGVDFDAIERANQADYAERTALNRRAKESRAAAGPLEVVGAPEAPVDDSALVDELQRAGEKNAEVARAVAATEARARSVTQYRTEAAHLEQKAATLRAAADVEESAPLPEIGAPVDVAAIRERIEQAKIDRRLFDLKVARQANLDNAASLEERADALSAAMQKRYDDRTAAIAAAKMPVPGLGLADGAVTLDGVPFEQASDAEKLKVSVALAMASNPKLRVVRVRDGSLLDADSLRVLGEMADANDCQVWLEKVSDGERVGFVIEDGHLKEDTTNEKESE